MNSTLDEPLVVNNGGGNVVATSAGEEQVDQLAGIGVRRLLPIEAERLQGFEDDWTAGESDSARYRMCGNAVAVPVIKWIAERLVEVDAGLESGRY